jgi:hypothetical protein
MEIFENVKVIFSPKWLDNFFSILAWTFLGIVLMTSKEMDFSELFFGFKVPNHVLKRYHEFDFHIMLQCITIAG